MMFFSSLFFIVSLLFIILTINYLAVTIKSPVAFTFYIICFMISSGISFAYIKYTKGYPTEMPIFETEPMIVGAFSKDGKYFYWIYDKETRLPRAHMIVSEDEKERFEQTKSILQKGTPAVFTEKEFQEQGGELVREAIISDILEKDNAAE